MKIKIAYVLIDSLAILDLLFVLRAVRQIKQRYGRIFKKVIRCSTIAILGNILVAIAMTPLFANIAYSVYFASLDWTLLYLAGFCLDYTDHEKPMDIIRPWGTALMAVDSVSLVLNFALGHQFDIYETRYYGTVFYQTSFHIFYYIHLAIDYLAVLVTFVFIIYRIVKSYDIYRRKYVMIFLVLVLVIVLNLVYMMFGLVLDLSVIFYALAGTIIYFGITHYVPRKLMNDSIAKAVNDMNEGIILFDFNNEYIFSNGFFNDRFTPQGEIFTIEDEPVATAAEYLKSTGMRTGQTEYAAKDADGNECHYQLRINNLLDRNGRPIGSYLLVEDDTETMLYLHEIDAARREADEANSAKSTFLANMSHEIRTPLNAVLGLNEMILRNSEDPEIIGYADNVRTSGEALLHLINDILDFSKIEAHKMDVIDYEYCPHDLVRECITRFERMAEEKDILLRVECDPSLPKQLVGDTQHLNQVISNIVSNALKYTKRGSVDVYFGADPGASDDRIKLKITVRDTGIGIAKEDLPYLFDAFERVNEKENANIQGTGLGLAITKELIHMMGGTIDVDSIPGEGSTFVVSVEQTVSDPEPVGEFRMQNTVEKVEYHESFRAPDAKVLIVDDVRINIMVITELLKKTGIVFDSALSGDEAIAKCGKKKYDLILLDHRMPKKDGIETFRELRSEGMNTDTPVVMLTANAESGALKEYMEMGFADYLSKPVDGTRLEEMMKRCLPGEKLVDY